VHESPVKPLQTRVIACPETYSILTKLVLILTILYCTLQYYIAVLNSFRRNQWK